MIHPKSADEIIQVGAKHTYNGMTTSQCKYEIQYRPSLIIHSLVLIFINIISLTSQATSPETKK